MRGRLQCYVLVGMDGMDGWNGWMDWMVIRDHRCSMITFGANKKKDLNLFLLGPGGSKKLNK